MRSISQSSGGCSPISLTLLILSALFKHLAEGDLWLAFSIWRRLRSALGRDLSSVHSSTISNTVFPKRSSISSAVVSVSSMVSCKMAAASTSSSLIPPTVTSRRATAIGLLMYGVPLDLRLCKRCFAAVNARASKIRFRSGDVIFVGIFNQCRSACYRQLLAQSRDMDLRGSLGDVELLGNFFV